jgi:hypothetical protein
MIRIGRAEVPTVRCSPYTRTSARFAALRKPCLISGGKFGLRDARAALLHRWSSCFLSIVTVAGP